MRFKKNNKNNRWENEKGTPYTFEEIKAELDNLKITDLKSYAKSLMLKTVLEPFYQEASKESPEALIKNLDKCSEGSGSLSVFVSGFAAEINAGRTKYASVEEFMRVAFGDKKTDSILRNYSDLLEKNPDKIPVSIATILDDMEQITNIIVNGFKNPEDANKYIKSSKEKYVSTTGKMRQVTHDKNTEAYKILNDPEKLSDFCKNNNLSNEDAKALLERVCNTLMLRSSDGCNTMDSFVRQPMESMLEKQVKQEKIDHARKVNPQIENHMRITEGFAMKFVFEDENAYENERNKFPYKIDDEVVEKFKVIIDKMNKYGMYSEESITEQDTKIYGFIGLVTKQNELKKATDPAKMEKLMEEIAVEKKHIHEVLDLCKQINPGKPFPGNMDNVRNNQIPGEFAFELEASAWFNTLYSLNSELHLQKKTIVEFAKNPLKDLEERYIKISEKENFYFSKIEEEKPDRDTAFKMLVVNTAKATSIPVYGGCRNADALGLADNKNYLNNALASAYFMGKMQAMADYAQSSFLHTSNLRTAYNRLGGLFLVEDKDLDYKKIGDGIVDPHTMVCTHFSINDYLKNHVYGCKEVADSFKEKMALMLEVMAQKDTGGNTVDYRTLAVSDLALTLIQTKFPSMYKNPEYAFLKSVADDPIKAFNDLAKERKINVTLFPTTDTNYQTPSASKRLEAKIAAEVGKYQNTYEAAYNASLEFNGQAQKLYQNVNNLKQECLNDPENSKLKKSLSVAENELFEHKMLYFSKLNKDLGSGKISVDFYRQATKFLNANRFDIAPPQIISYDGMLKMHEDSVGIQDPDPILTAVTAAVEEMNKKTEERDALEQEDEKVDDKEEFTLEGMPGEEKQEEEEEFQLEGMGPQK